MDLCNPIDDAEETLTSIHNEICVVAVSHAANSRSSGAKFCQHDKFQQASPAQHLHATKGSSHEDSILGCGDGVPMFEEH